jgi:hypothetical protein
VPALALGDNSGYPTKPGAGVVVVDGRVDSVQGAMYGARVVVVGVAGGTVPAGSRSAEAEA